MRRIFAMVILCFLMSSLSGQTVGPEEASKFIGQKKTVCGKVFGGRFLENAKDGPTLLNMGAAYPNNPFTFVIFANDRKNFAFKPEEFLIDKDVCVTGDIKDYKGKPEIVLTDSTQIRIK